MAGEEGFEPSQSDPESDVLPLDDSPVESVSIADYSRGSDVCKVFEQLAKRKYRVSHIRFGLAMYCAATVPYPPFVLLWRMESPAPASQLAGGSALRPAQSRFSGVLVRRLGNSMIVRYNFPLRRHPIAHQVVALSFYLHNNLFVPSVHDICKWSLDIQSIVECRSICSSDVQPSSKYPLIISKSLYTRIA